MVARRERGLDFNARTEETGDGAYVIAVAGEADLYSAPELKRELDGALEAGGKDIVVDLTRTTFIDSTALSVLVEATKRVRPEGGRVALVCVDRNLVKIFRITALDRLFPLFSSRDDALRSLTPAGARNAGS
jgi:anti-sigma B factor antagonist